jgi:hypothetical protein
MVALPDQPEIVNVFEPPPPVSWATSISEIPIDSAPTTSAVSLRLASWLPVTVATIESPVA